MIAVAAGSFQSELGCPGDWDPTAYGRGSRTRTATGSTPSRRRHCPPGSYETKVAINESWDENYGQGGVAGRREHPVHAFRSTTPGSPSATTRRRTCSPSRSPAPTDAPDGPGALSHFDLARKDCLGTARNTSSKVWYTVANGVLSDVYYPTVDNTNVETLQYVVTDGSTFTDLQTRDMTYTVAPVERHAAGWPAR